MSGKRTPELIGHLDADCFYVSAERVRYPYMVGMPVGVLGNQGACVIEKSYEMKSKGVGTGMPIWEAVKRCPDGLYAKRDFRWYEVLSRAMLATVRDLAGLTEWYPIDEAFFDATPPRGVTPVDYARRIRDAVMAEVGVPVTVGIARTRTLAKLISDTGKPFGAVAVIGQQEEEAVLSRLGVAEVTGIGGRREARLHLLGIRTCLDFINADRRLIREELTSVGEALWWELRGEHALPLHPERPLHKVIARGGSFGQATRNPNVLWAWLVRNLERLVEELEFHEVKPGRVALKVEYRGGYQGEGEETKAKANLEAPSDRFDILLEAFRPLARRNWRPRLEAQRMHVQAELLRPRYPLQQGLFGDFGGTEATRRREAVAAVKRAINERHGRFVVRSGATLALPEVYRDEMSEYDVCDIRGKICF